MHSHADPHRPVYLPDLQRDEILRLVPGQTGEVTTLAAFASIPEIEALGWPLDVVDQWLYEHLPLDEFLCEYVAVDLSRVRWSREELSTEVLEVVPTGKGGADYLAQEAPDYHGHWIKVRGGRVVRSWEEQGTWLRAPILLDRGCFGGPSGALQLVEGRTRVGVMRGRLRDGLNVAPQHTVWIGRPALDPTP